MSNKIEYISYGNESAGAYFCSGMETIAENLIEDNDQDAVIIFPEKNKFATPRSQSYRMTTENAEIHLPYPIYKIKKVLLRAIGMQIGVSYPINSMGATHTEWANFEEFKNKDGAYLSEIDITKWVVNRTEWEALPTANSLSQYLTGLFKDNTLYWEKGQDIIPILGTVYKIGGVIFGDLFADKTPTYNRLLRSAVATFGEDYEYEYVAENTLKKTTLSARAIAGETINTDPRKWQFRVEYVPIVSHIKLRAYKKIT